MLKEIEFKKFPFKSEREVESFQLTQQTPKQLVFVRFTVVAISNLLSANFLNAFENIAENK